MIIFRKKLLFLNGNVKVIKFYQIELNRFNPNSKKYHLCRNGRAGSLEKSYQ